MTHTATNLFASAYSGFSPQLLAAATCTLNGKAVDCGAGGGVFGLWFVVLALTVGIVTLVANWKLYMKAGKPGWASIVPVYNMVVMLEITKKPIWWVLLMFIPIVNLIVGLIVSYALAQAFGKGIGFTIGIIILPFIFLPLLAFGDSKYQLGDMEDVPMPPQEPSSLPPSATA
jgi:hypothetical protein